MAKKAWVSLAAITTVMLLVISVGWSRRQDWAEPLGRYTWIAGTSWLSVAASGLVSWMDCHGGATAGILGAVGLMTQVWGVLLKARAKREES